MNTLPDILGTNMEILFVGTNPGLESAQRGHYFAKRGNRFWQLLFEAGLTDRQLKPEEDKEMLSYGYGLTDVIKRPTRSIKELTQLDKKKNAGRIDKIVTKYKPKIVTFVGKKSIRIYLRKSNEKLKYGRQKIKISHSIVYLLPSTSGQSYRDTNLDEKRTWFSKLARIKVNNCGD
jgi:TDG/mug DNA glycosylase family protein